jgi:hypothetical protein
LGGTVVAALRQRAIIWFLWLHITPTSSHCGSWMTEQAQAVDLRSVNLSHCRTPQLISSITLKLPSPESSGRLELPLPDGQVEVGHTGTPGTSLNSVTG